MAKAAVEDVVELGFVEEAPHWLLRSKFFRGKIGGKPSWLNLEDLPEADDLKCGCCSKPCVFLMQVYAPIDDSVEAFHRTIFLFVCASGKCCKNSQDAFIAYRNQLPRRNKYYDFEPPLEVEKDSQTPSANQFQTLCDLCGSKSIAECTIEQKNYCSQQHQEIDKKAGQKNSYSNAEIKKRKIKSLLPQYELVTDTEPLPSNKKEKSDEEKMKEYHQFLKSDRAKSCMQETDVEDLEALIRKPDKVFNKFQKRVALEKDQVLRYQKGGIPLWVSSEGTPTEKDIPRCLCGAERSFEFQVMPQLLNHLLLDGMDSMDWGTIAIYTCSKSCNLRSSYAKEFAWKQDFSDNVKT